MKVYLQTLKFQLKTLPKTFAFILFGVLSISAYKIFFLESSRGLFTQENITIAQIIFRVLFSLVILVAYGVVFIFLRGFFSISIFQLFPGIRKKVLLFGYINLAIIFIWGVFILGLNDLNVIKVFTMTILWFISSCMILIFFDTISVYRSNKYWILKLFFALFSFIAPMVAGREPSKHPLVYYSIISVFLLVVFYQTINFIRNYIDFRLKEDFTREGFGLKMNSLQNIIDNFYARKVVNTIGVVKNKKDKERYGKLIHITLLGIEFFTPWILIGTAIGLAYAKSVIEMKPRSMFIASVLYFTFFSLTNTPRIFKKKDEIMFLYQRSNIRRNDFELLILKTAIKVYFIRMLKIVIPIFAVVIIYNMYFGYADPYFLIKLILTISAIQLFFIYYFWKTIMRNKDYDLLKHSTTIRKGLVSLENIIK